MNDIALQSKEKSAQLLWMSFIVMFFVIQAIIWIVAITITSRDTSHTVVAGYDEQALNWDEVKQKRAASVALGWTADVKVDPTGDILGNRVVALVLKDRNETPIENASLQLEAYHRGRAAEVQQIQVTEVGPGVYSGEVRVRHAGLWQINGSATKGDQVYLVNQQLQLNLSKGQ